MMAIGVPYDLYWSGEPSAVAAYITAHEIRQENKLDEMDMTAWLIGSYVHEGVAVVLSGLSGKNKGRGYPKEPYGRKRKREKNTDAMVLRAFTEMKALVGVYNARRQKSTDSKES